MTAQTTALVFQPRRRPWLARLGDWMAARRRAILGLQGAIVLLYAFLVVVPAFLPHPHAEARLFSGDFGAAFFVDPQACVADGRPAPLQEKAPYAPQWHERLVLLAQYLFWGLWWPFVILSVMLLGRLWCGVLCPEGALSEFASRHGRGGRIPRWVRWGGWPFLAFVLTTLYGQLVSVYEYPRAALLILGGSTLAAVAVGWMYGRGKRVWCRYLCPVSGVFNLLARVAPVHFRVDRAAWEAHPGRTSAVDCAPLIDVKHMRSAGECHACGRCSGHRGAVALSARSPNAEVLTARAPRTAEALLLVFGMLGIALGAFTWSVSPWFVALKQAAAEWLVERNLLWPLQADAPWWLLTHYPEANDAFSWLDGALILAWIGGVALVLGSTVLLGLTFAARCAKLDWRALSLSLTPLAGLGLFLGLSMMTVSHLRAEGVPLGWLPTTRAALLGLGLLWSGWLGVRLLFDRAPNARQAAMALPGLVLPLAAVGTVWILVFFIW